MTRENPENLRYTEDHEWVRTLSEDTVRMGITDFAQRQLGDVVMLELPEVGQYTDARGEIGTVESTKAVSEVYAPVSGEVVAVNEGVIESPELVNDDPYGDGWLVEIKLESPVEEALAGLLDASAYQALTEES